MKTIKASLRLNKNGRLFCTLHNTYRVTKPPRNGCNVCWTLYDNTTKQFAIDAAVEAIAEALKGQQK
jgi:hypothetical protein